MFFCRGLTERRDIVRMANRVGLACNPGNHYYDGKEFKETLSRIDLAALN
jgi:hypothetical protein